MGISNKQLFTQQAKDFLKSISDNNYFKETNNEIILRCPYCGDSQKHKNKARFYISKNIPTGYSLPMFHCFNGNCNESGNILRLFKDFGLKITDDNIKDYLNIDESMITNINYKIKKNKIKYQNLKNEMNDVQRSYMEGRLGPLDRISTNASLEKHIVYNIDLIWDYILDYYKTDLSKMYEILKDKSIGFISTNNTTISFRTLGNYKHRYVKYKITDSFTDYFIIHNPDGVHNEITVAEGAFDILNLYNRNKLNSEYFIAMQSNNYSNIVEYIILNLNKFYFDLNVVIDSDYDYKYLKYIKNNHFIKQLNIYGPVGSKDVGEGDISIKLLQKI